MQKDPLHNLKLFRTNRDGNFGVLTALMLVPLIGIAGLAVDLGMAVDERSALMNAADAAAVGALSEKSATVAQAMNMSANGEIQLGNDDARRLFLAQLPQSLRDRLSNVAVSIKRENTELTSNVSFTAAIPTAFMGILGKDSIGVSGTAKATYKTNAFIDFFMLLDNTPSMGLGATNADIAKLEASFGCAFACHATGKAADNTLEAAGDLGVKLRIDIVRDATKKLTEDVDLYKIANNQYRMAVYSFGTSADDIGLKEIAKLTSNMDNVDKAVDNLDLMSTVKNNYNDNQLTDFASTFASIKSVVGTVGTGSSATDRQKVVFLVSDGMTDAAKTECSGSAKGTRCMEPIDATVCKDLKDKGIKVAVVYTTYIPLPDDSFWVNRIKPFDSRLRPSMEACATQGYFIEASPSEDIGKAMQTLFRKLMNSPRLTN
ncbi:pilus assembly protein TadG-related protein [Rhizobium sp. FKY42]|uniref:pilus assembly protein TadG-related protein n=1 Tax=Rhizobium sp. FKY42 TaxID=2562310 RepID=UPI0010C14866|nr:pilus assembly protein TadG-related protein [Rhizobium sp. FKY42]